MATYTTNYNLKKPALADKIRIADFNGNSDTIDGAMHDNAVLGAQLKSDIGIVENTNTATHNISAGQYVIWKGDLYTASDAISSGATLSNANLTAVSGGGLNALNSKYTHVSFASSSDLSAISNSSPTTVSDSYTVPSGYELFAVSDLRVQGFGSYYDWVVTTRSYYAVSGTAVNMVCEALCLGAGSTTNSKIYADIILKKI